ncbi:MAG: hypothetical protein WD624_06530, partial [Rhodospirillales bacterium]
SQIRLLGNHESDWSQRALKAREADPNFQSTIEGKIRMPDGTSQTMTGNLMTSDMAEKSFVSFDKWLELQEQVYTSSEKRLEMAQKNMDRLEQDNPDTSSNVRSTFSSGGTLLAYINADGTVAMSNLGPKHGESMTHTAMERKIYDIVANADKQNLAGKNRVDYLEREIGKALSQRFKDLNTESYNDASAPSKRAFGNRWYTNFDIDQHYNDAMSEAKASYAEARAWHDQWQNNMNEMNRFLLSLQEAA